MTLVTVFPIAAGRSSLLAVLLSVILIRKARLLRQAKQQHVEG